MKTIVLFLLCTALLPGSTITSIGDLGGDITFAYRISDSGIIAGYAQVHDGDMHAFSVAPGGRMRDRNGNADESAAYGVNTAGQIAGVSYMDGQTHGTIWSKTGKTDLGAGYSAMAINDSGQVAGGNGQAFLYDHGTTRELGTLPGGDWSSAYDINSAGTVAGTGTAGRGRFEAFIWTAGSGMQALGTLGGSSSYGMAINDLGQVAGLSAVRSGYDHAFVVSNGVMQDLGTLGGGNSYGYDLNNAGVVVGYSFLPGDCEAHAFAYLGGRMIDLNSLLPPDSGWTLDAAYGINNQGDIVGTGTYHGHQKSFLFASPALAVTDVPEPAPTALTLIGLLVLLWRRKA